MTTNISSDINDAIAIFARMPGLGPRSAQRVILHLLKNEYAMNGMLLSLNYLTNNIARCTLCNNLDVSDICTICQNQERNDQLLCIVEDVADLWNIEQSGHFNGRYYVLDSSSDAPPTKNVMEKLMKRVDSMRRSLHEIILASNATLHGQSLSFYLTDELKERMADWDVTPVIAMLGHGMPIGAELDYLDDGTIGAAFRTRSRC